MEVYESEKSAILRRSQDVEHEMKELADKYASLLGHQNTRQKIHHVEKLKAENVKLKQVWWPSSRGRWGWSTRTMSAINAWGGGICV